MKLDVKVLRYMSNDEFRVLGAVEQGQKNHEIVPMPLIAKIAGLRHGGVHKLVSELLRNKLLAHNNTNKSRVVDGYRLTTMGYDYLALRVFLRRGQIAGVGRQVGIGKESDIFEVQNKDGDVLALKIHRLGRTSFRAIKEKRDYLEHRRNASWLYMSRLAAVKEYAFMKALHGHGFPTPTPVDQNRHMVLMSMVKGAPMYQVKRLSGAAIVYRELMELIVRFAEHGLIHCDFNEFNIMLSPTGQVTVIDFPQMVSMNHPNAKSYFDRDVGCIRRWFGRIYKYTPEADVASGNAGEWDAANEHLRKPRFSTMKRRLAASIDEKLQASGFSLENLRDLEAHMESQRCAQGDDEERGGAAGEAPDGGAYEGKGCAAPGGVLGVADDSAAAHAADGAFETIVPLKADAEAEADVVQTDDGADADADADVDVEQVGVVAVMPPPALPDAEGGAAPSALDVLRAAGAAAADAQLPPELARRLAAAGTEGNTTASEEDGVVEDGVGGRRRPMKLSKAERQEELVRLRVKADLRRRQTGRGRGNRRGGGKKGKKKGGKAKGRGKATRNVMKNRESRKIDAEIRDQRQGGGGISWG